MSIWRELTDFSLDNETQINEQEQMEWIARDPADPRPFYHLAQLRRMQYKPDQGLALLLEAIRLDETFAPAHVALTELYAVKGDYSAAWRHARQAEQNNEARGVDLLTRYKIPES
jgi:tetratricopeptide (TPR) repeat protein